MNSEKDASGRPAASVLAVAMAAILTFVLAGCATPPPPVEETKLVWPAPPLPTRIRFVRSITSEQDLKADTTFTQGLAAFLTGEKIPAGRIAEPMGLAVSDDGERLYVSDPLQHTVFNFNFKTKTLSKVEGIDFPAGIALDARENLYVVDTAKKSIGVFGLDGKFIKEIADPSIERPVGIAIDRQNGRIYLVDTGSTNSKEQNVKIFNLEGKKIGAIGGAPGGDFGQFSFPTMAAVDDKGNVYVSDTLNSRVQKFDVKGNFVTSFGQLGTAWGEFDKPKGVALDSFGNLYVVDSGWSNIQIFNPKGQVLLFFGGRGPIPGMMKNPISIAIDKKNRIYVGDYLNHRIGVYDLVNTAAEDSFVKPPPNPEPKGKK
jgi:DNA-binding beta-propeller fold protein YncE